MATYVVQRRENFTGGIINIQISGRRGVSMLTLVANQMVLSYEVFNCFGMHSLFEGCCKAIILVLVFFDIEQRGNARPVL